MMHIWEKFLKGASLFISNYYLTGPQAIQEVIPLD